MTTEQTLALPLMSREASAAILRATRKANKGQYHDGVARIYYTLQTARQSAQARGFRLYSTIAY